MPVGPAMTIPLGNSALLVEPPVLEMVTWEVR